VEIWVNCQHCEETPPYVQRLAQWSLNSYYLWKPCDYSLNCYWTPTKQTCILCRHKQNKTL
jgi:hypothetical protein